MSRPIARREFLVGIGAVAATAGAAYLHGNQQPDTAGVPRAMKSVFRVGVISDEIAQDFGRACEVASREFGMEWVELRDLWNKNVLNLDAEEMAEARRVMKKYQLRITDIASPLFKVNWPSAPPSQYAQHDEFKAGFTFAQQDEVLERAVEAAKFFGTDRVRCFDFWRLDDQTPYRAAINEKLLQAANKAGRKGITLVLENESACNTATGAESAKVLEAVKSPYFMLNWDPGNAAASGETPFPGGYNLLPKERIGHCHCKDVVKKGKKYDWAPMGGGIIDWAGQFKALKRDGYHFAVSLETHWGGGGTQEESSRKSWAGMKKLLHQADAL